MQIDVVKTKGEIEITIDYRNGSQDKVFIHNTVLAAGRNALASSLANDYGSSYPFFIDTMTFGTGGVDGDNNPKFVDASRSSLYNSILEKPASSIVDPNNTNEVVFTSVLAFGDAVGEELSEMALQMSNGDLYSMATMPMISKTIDMQLTWTWRITFI